MINQLSATPKISVVTVSFNQGEFIRQNIESVLQQNYPNFEHIVVDGGSTDGTLEILQSYPHLKWKSEPDRNQCHALNKGFAQASGDIIAWLNSDDWYAPGAFQAVAAALNDSEVVLTAAAETDRQGQVKQTVPNTGRTFHDLLRYWVPYAWLAQTGVFFRRSLLEASRRPNGDYVDESLNFVMDFDLWLRMAARAPFTKQLDKICAYFRIYDENKTGRNPLSTQKECGRVFRRFAHEHCQSERTISVVLPLDDIDQSLTPTLNSLIDQDLYDFDISIVDYSPSQEAHQRILTIVEELEKTSNAPGIRYQRSKAVNALGALHHGILQAATPLVANALPGVVFEPEFMREALNAFSIDPVGAALPLGSANDVWQALFDEKTHRIRIDSLASALAIPPLFIVRKVAYEEIAKDLPLAYEQLYLRMLCAKLANRGWHVNVSDKAAAQFPAPIINDPERFNALVPFMSAMIFEDARLALNESPFASVRRLHGWAPAISQAAVESAGKMLQLASADVRAILWSR